MCTREKIQKAVFVEDSIKCCFLAQRGLAFQGDGDEISSNFVQPLQLCRLDDPRIRECVPKKANKYTIFKMNYLNQWY